MQPLVGDTFIELSTIALACKCTYNCVLRVNLITFKMAQKLRALLLFRFCHKARALMTLLTLSAEELTSSRRPEEIKKRAPS